MATTQAITGVHPYAEKFPMLPEADLAELAESVRANGLRNPVVVTPDGLILDGRNRVAACERAGIQPNVVVYDGADLAEYVIDCNSARRHMGTGARAMATALVLAEDGRRDGGRWRRGSVLGADVTESRNTWKDAVRTAGIVLDHAADLAPQVVTGDLALDAAYRQAVERRDTERTKLEEQERRRQEEADAQAFIEDNAPDLAAQVGGPFQTYVEALAVWEKRNREEAARRRAEQQENKRRQDEERQARSDLYTGIAKAALTLGDYGDFADIPKLMADYDPRELNPPQYARALEPDNLRGAQRVIGELIKWRSA